jgi:hypothetical protein
LPLHFRSGKEFSDIFFRLSFPTCSGIQYLVRSSAHPAGAARSPCPKGTPSGRAHSLRSSRPLFRLAKNPCPAASLMCADRVASAKIFYKKTTPS